ncbi:Trehalose-phosphatase [Erysiphe necator]|uniref:Putative glycosyltransferase family 20 n=1 Tax=Uncinula necator TaxID=52586 RepID=A0A0B1PC95_UNCNE|nr:Trehalose-phosphatase [Erysiphe necator]KHJ34586.1 putative glycosyltransferase family 20 [Erysiphe necator]
MAQPTIDKEAIVQTSLMTQHRISLSFSDDSMDETILDPIGEYPGLNFSGNVISVAFCIPYSLKYVKGSEWRLSPRRGKSALVDSFTYLSSEKTPWNHTLVGWTGEITIFEDQTPPPTPPVNPSSSRYMPLNKSSAPIPVDAFTNPPEPLHIEGLWIPKQDQDQLNQQLFNDKICRTVPVWLQDKQESTADGILLKDQTRWRRFAERNLYTLFHYKQNEATDGITERQLWEDYHHMNQQFANCILKIYKPGDILIIHDYHLFLLPSMLRHIVPRMYISFFLHIPFPSSELLRCLPRRKEILEGALGADLVGFQSPSYSRHFVSCCTRILGFPTDIMGVETDVRKVIVGIFPIGINAAAVEKAAFENPLVDEKVEALNSLYKGIKIIVGRDRLDTLRGVSQKMIAFERFLADFPQWQGKVVLIQVTSPTSIEGEAEDAGNRITKKISEIVANINGTYGSLSFSPVQHYPKYLSQPEYLAILRAADIGLITSVRDGMNTTSLEYVVCQRDRHCPLILSEFSGTAGSLKHAIHINPWDTSGVSKQINAALTMSSDKKAAMHRSLYHHVTTRNIQAWADNFLRRLLVVLNGIKSVVSTPLLDKDLFLKQYQASSRRLFMFDYDGTLTPIVHDPSAALPSKFMINTLKTLATNPKNSVWIISGRDQAFLQQHLGHIRELGLSAEHGSFLRHPCSLTWENLASLIDLQWQAEVLETFRRYTQKTPGAFVERKRCALTWHYRPSDPILGAYQADECRKEIERDLGKKWDIEVMTGKANIEVRPSFINKGEIVKRLISEFDPKPDFVFCVGDDFTDEDMFRELKAANLANGHDFIVKVGKSSQATIASWYLPEPEDVISFTSSLCLNENIK